MSDWLKLMLGEIARREQEHAEAERERRRRLEEAEEEVPADPGGLSRDKSG